MEFDLRIKETNNTDFTIADNDTKDLITLVNDAFAYTLHDARISTSNGVEIEQNVYVEPTSTIMRLVTQKVVDLCTFFEKIDETDDGINNSSIKEILINNHIVANRGVIRGHLPPA